MTAVPGRGREPTLGTRQAAVMALLWQQPGRFMTVRNVFDAVDDDLAYTTVMTVLSRLHLKGLLERRREGRAWTYRPSVSETEYTARAMTVAFHDSHDRHGTLLHFVEHLTPEEQRALRDRLASEDV